MPTMPVEILPPGEFPQWFKLNCKIKKLSRSMISQDVVTPGETGVESFSKRLKRLDSGPAPDPIRGLPECPNHEFSGFYEVIEIKKP